MKNLAVSRRYAKALILIGQEDGLAEHYNSELGSVVGLFDTQEDFEKTLTNPLFNKNDRKKVLQAVLAATDLSAIMKSFLILLFDKGRIGFLREIASYYNDLADELKGVVKASIVSATELSSEAIYKIKAALSKKTGKNIVLNVEQDPNLIGGVVTKLGDLVLDGSVKTQLINMRETLKKGESV
ncbi:MAG: F0F1 ATP synthase subunit delta [Deltaproteobacteria bacterium]|uniref:ATP synthase F1 subunit delta n=1 Tax=Desulfobacula sp. TaxID=2593537 RepID=UPI0019C20674|nr:F0F1 ATP synthase subunit delta [Candidatus Desulfobacula maris]MBL6994786.1 F0F1 ATP synthase subunit delta [Desulfobacula sp.]